jgi:hypothetical protein
LVGGGRAGAAFRVGVLWSFGGLLASLVASKNCWPNILDKGVWHTRWGTGSHCKLFLHKMHLLGL